MTTPTAAQHHLYRIFFENFSAADIAEPLASFDAGTSAAEVLSVMTRRAYRVAGIRRDGTICGYVRQEELADGTCADAIHAFDDDDLAADSAGLPELVIRLNDRPQLFITVFGQVGGIVTRTDLQKPPVRMWLFGMITIIEMGLTRLIETAYPDGSWRQYLSEGRLQKAEALLEERKRRNQAMDLLDCLQFSDRGQIVLRNEPLRKLAGFVSRSRGEQTVKELEALRNNLAHSQDIVRCDWDIIVKMTGHLDTLLESPAQHLVGGNAPE